MQLRAGRLARRTVVAALLAALVGFAGPAVADDTLDCTPMGDQACRDLTPVAECVWPNSDGSTTVVWGFDNPSTKTLRIEPGAHNRVSPGPDDQGQPRLFPPGRTRNAFVVTFTGSSGSWRLGNTDVSTSASTPKCATKPVPVVGSVEALLLGLVVIGLVLLALLAARRRVTAVPA